MGDSGGDLLITGSLHIHTIPPCHGLYVPAMRTPDTRLSGYSSFGIKQM